VRVAMRDLFPEIESASLKELLSDHEWKGWGEEVDRKLKAQQA